MTRIPDDFALKRALDALPREIDPPEDYWPAIRAGMAHRAFTKARPEPRFTWSAKRVRLAAMVTLLVASAGTLMVTRRNAGRWQLATTSVSVRPFVVGEQFVSGGDSARLTVGRIGEVDVESGTAVRLLRAKWSEHRLALARGTIHARISAPPRLFIVETPSGTAVDMGCAYTLAVDSVGNSRLVVTDGWVEFADHGRMSLIPAGFSAASRRGAGVGTPVADRAPAALVTAVDALDRSAMANDSALGVVLALAEKRDAVTLWHVLGSWRGSDDQRRRVYDKLAAMVPPPTVNATFDAVQRDPWAMKLWWEELPGTLPIVPEWQRRLWTTWLRVTG